MKESLKLYRVKLRGILLTYNPSYVVAHNPTEALDLVQESLSHRDMGFAKDREMNSIDLIAEGTDYPNCGAILYGVAEKGE